jgi:hypothetical protein
MVSSALPERCCRVLTPSLGRVKFLYAGYARVSTNGQDLAGQIAEAEVCIDASLPFRRSRQRPLR